MHHRDARRRRERARNWNLSEKIVKENFSNLVKEIDMQVLEAQIIPNMMDAKRPTPRYIIIKMPKFKDNKDTILKAVRKELSYLQGSSHKPVS